MNHRVNNERRSEDVPRDDPESGSDQMSLEMGSRREVPSLDASEQKVNGMSRLGGVLVFPPQTLSHLMQRYDRARGNKQESNLR